MAYRGRSISRILVQPVLFVVGLALFYWSAMEVKSRPHKNTIPESISEHEARLNGLETNWVELGKLEPRVDKLEKFSKAAVGMIPGFFEHDNRITLLETKIDEIITDCLTLRKMYSREQAAAALPFSDWVADSAAVAPDPKTRLGARIVRSLLNRQHHPAW